MSRERISLLETVDLHVHLRGTIAPDMARYLAARNGVELPCDLFRSDGTYRWSNFSEFLRAYDAVGAVVRTATDLETIAEKYLLTSALEGTIYVEFMLSPGHLANAGIPYEEQIFAVAAAADRARAACGIECRLIATCVRHHGPHAAVGVVKLVTGCPHPIVVGFGMTGNELQYEAIEFKAAFDIARDAGLKLTAHAGEFRGPESVLDSLQHLRLDRIGHGVRSVESPRALEELRLSGVGLEVCLTSNVALGLVTDVDAHPFERLRAAGCVVTLATDDPAYFETSVAREYSLAQQTFGLCERTLKEITHQAISAAFCDEATKAVLLRKVERDGITDDELSRRCV
jgi:adenosine deaminase